MKELSLKKLQSMMTQKLLKSLNHKFMTPVNLIKSMNTLIKRKTSSLNIEGKDQITNSIMACEESTLVLE